MKRLALLTVGVLVTLLALAGPAFAHVTVSAPGATRGGSDQEITFRVPTEKKVATVGLTVQLPTDTPIASVLVEPMPGWTYTTTTTKLAKPVETDDGEITEAVSQINWRATGAGIGPGEFGAFTIIAGQLPDAPSLTFKALQRYEDGTITRWIEVPAPGSTAEPENPAPVLDLPSPTAKDVRTEKASNTGPVTLSIIALVLAAAALGFGVVNRVRSRG
jgi:periplasmic copper chaperone A